jgi:hypothetical protein
MTPWTRSWAANASFVSTGSIPIGMDKYNIGMDKYNKKIIIVTMRDPDLFLSGTAPGSPLTTGKSPLKTRNKPKPNTPYLTMQDTAQPRRPQRPTKAAHSKIPSSRLRLARGCTPPSGGLRPVRGGVLTSGGLRPVRGGALTLSGLRLARGSALPLNGVRLARGRSARALLLLYAGI